VSRHTGRVGLDIGHVMDFLANPEVYLYSGRPNLPPVRVDTDPASPARPPGGRLPGPHPSPRPS